MIKGKEAVERPRMYREEETTWRERSRFEPVGDDNCLYSRWMMKERSSKTQKTPSAMPRPTLI
jgi:hypothetical protein